MTSQPRIEFLTKLNSDIAQWEQLRDAQTIANLDGVLSPALMFRRADGTVVDKDTFMRALKNPGPFTQRESRDIAVTVLGDRALVTLLVLGTKGDGRIGRYRNVRLFSGRGEDWRLEFWFNDDVTDQTAQTS